MPNRKRKGVPMDQTQKKLLKTSSKGSWYKQDISNEKHQEDKVGTPSSRKIQLPEMKSEDIPAGRIIIEMRILNEYLENVACCKLCKLGRVSLKSDQTKRMGLSNNLIWECDNLNCSLKTEMNTSKLCTDSKVPEINRALVLGMRTLGKGREAAAKLCAALDLPAPVSKPSYSNHIKKIESLTKPVLDMELANAAERVRTYKIENEDHSDSEMIECGVTVDGTWLNRGVSSRHGFVSVISVDTGEVLDYHYMCSVCPDCETWEDKTSQEYLELFVEHEPKCKLNYEGSSQNMETEGASILFGRSAEKHNLRYNPFIGDGDSKAYNRVLREKPYGPDFQIKKEECIGHIQKRMGTRLRNLINKMKGQKLSDGKPLSGPGRLTLAMVDSFQVWYGQAIRNNKGDAEKMSNATMAILLHYSEKADHSYCPKGKESWCKWQSDIVTGETTYTPVSNPLPPAVVQQIQPVFEFLSSKNLLQGCVNCLTQNQNESLHHAVWRFIPKDQNHSSTEVEVGIRLGILKFNGGITKMTKSVFSSCGIDYTENMEKQFIKMDKDRITCAEIKMKESSKSIRKEKRQKHKRRIDAFRHKEGPTYKSGNFHVGKPQSKLKAVPKCKKCGKPRKGHARGKC